MKEANVPTISIANSANWYNKLLVTIGPQNNPSDAKFAIAISTNAFGTTQYVKSDFTVGNTLALSDYQTYAGWNSASGTFVRGLLPSTVYTVKSKAFRGEYSESPYGPTAAVSTVDPQLSFDIDVSAIDVSTNPPYVISFGNLLVSTITDSSTKVWVSLQTNGESGGKVYMSGQNSGLKSTSANYTIGSTAGDINAQLEGFGAQGATATQASGGPLALIAPYDGVGQNIGATDNLIREMFSTSSPIVAGRGSFILKAKTKPLTPASSDYAEILTVVAAASF